MTKKDHIAYWLNMSIKDWKTAEILHRNGRHLHALFFVHLTLEKTLKAIWVRDNYENVPPLVHNLIFIYDQTNLILDSSATDLLQSINQYNIEGRYQDYKGKAYKRATKEYTQKKVKECSELHQYLLQEMQSK